MSNKDQNPETLGVPEDARDRLLDTAEKLFCEKGFHATSVRELTTGANCNIAAVNYHFGGKENLYREMFRRQFQFMINEHLQTIKRVMSEPKPTVEKLMRAIITPAINRIVQDEANSKVLRMLVREVLDQRIDPKPMCKEIKSQFFDQLGKALKRLVPELPDDSEQLTLVVCSIDGVVLHPFLFYEMYSIMMPGVSPDQLIDHMEKFIVSAIRGYATQQ
jgi:AcrR family transcriptional regulator